MYFLISPVPLEILPVVRQGGQGGGQMQPDGTLGRQGVAILVANLLLRIRGSLCLLSWTIPVGIRM